MKWCVWQANEDHRQCAARSAVSGQDCRCHRAASLGDAKWRLLAVVVVVFAPGGRKGPEPSRTRDRAYAEPVVARSPAGEVPNALILNALYHWLNIGA